MSIGRIVISLFAGYSFCLFLASYNEFFLSWYFPLLIAAAIFPLLVKFPNNIWTQIILSIATAIPISTLLMEFIPETIKLEINLKYLHLSKMETTTIIVSVFILLLPYLKLNWIKGVLKNALFAASFLILLTYLSVNYIPGGFGMLIYVVIPFLLPLIYHASFGKIKLFRTLTIAIVSYALALGLDYYFVRQAKVQVALFEEQFLGFQIINYFIPVTFLVTLFLGYNHLGKQREQRIVENQP